MTREQLHHDVELGLCSGFRSCCIAYFVFIWVPMLNKYGPPTLDWSRAPDRRVVSGSCAYLRHYWRQLAKLPDAVEYVPCPRCLIARDFVTVRRCAPDRCEHYELHGVE